MEERFVFERTKTVIDGESDERPVRDGDANVQREKASSKKRLATRYEGEK